MTWLCETMEGGRDIEYSALDRLAVETQIKEPATSEETNPNHSEYNSNPYISIRSPSSNDSRSNGHVVDAGRVNGYGYHNPNRVLARSISEFTASSTTDHKCVSKCTIYILQLMTLLSLLLACVSVAITTKLWAKCNDLETRISAAEGTYTAGLADLHVCMPCDDLVRGLPEDNEQLRDLNLIQKEKNGSMTCCAKSAEQISILLDLFVKRKQLENRTSEITNCESSSGYVGESNVPPGTPSRHCSKPSAHLRMIPGKTNISTKDSENPIRRWSHHGKGAHLCRISLVDDRLLIQETGTYFLYSQVGFFIFYNVGTKKHKSDLANQTLFHKVFRYKATYPNGGSQELLRSEHTQCWEQNKLFGRYTSYVGAALKLNRGDQLYVKVSRLSALNTHHSLTYFGIFKIDE